MYARNLTEGGPSYWEGNEVYEPVKDDMTYGVIFQYLKVEHPCPLHHHAEIEQIYYIRTGRGIMTVGAEEREVGPETVIFVPPGAEHCLAPLEGEKNLTYLCVCHYHEISSKELRHD